MFKNLIAWSKRYWWLLVAVLVLLIIGLWWRNKTSTTEDMNTVQPEVRDLNKTINFSGQVNADKRVVLRFATGGKINYIGAQKGDEVKQGQTIASLDQRSLQKQIDKQLSLYETQRLSFENQMDTYDDRWLDTQESRIRQQDQLALNRTVLDVELKSLSVDSYLMTAPFAGIIVEAPFEVTGVQVQPTDSWQLVDPTTLYFEVFVDEVDIDEVEIGQQVAISLDARPQEELQGVVDDISYQTINTAEGAVFAIKVRFMDPVSINRQRLGMNGEAKLLITQKQQVLSLPIETLISRDGNDYVEVLKSGEKQEVAIQTGLETQDYIEVVEGLTPNDQVIMP